MECNRDEAKRAKEIAENKFSAKDIIGAKKFALKAQSLYPALDGISQFLAILDVYVAAENKVNGELDLYGILGLNPLADDDTARKHFRKLALSLHPDKNKSIGAEGAFQFVSQAWTVLSDKEKRSVYDHKRRNVRVFNQNGGSRFHNFTKNTAGRTRVVITNAKGTTASPKNDINATTKMETGAGPIKTVGSGPSSNKQTMPKTFWTVCKRCKLQYEYVRKYLNRNLLCPTCYGPFLATETAPPNTNASSENAKGSSENGSIPAGHGTSTQRSPLNTLVGVKRDREEAHKKEAKLPSKTKQDDNGSVENTQKGPTEVKKDATNTGVIKNQQIKKAAIEIKRKLNKWTSETYKDSSVAELLVSDIPDPQFYDFDSDRNEKCFKEGQVWACYDDYDGMPRLCAMIKKVISLNPFKMKVCWLKMKNVSKPDNNPGRVRGFFGEFKPGIREIVSTPNYFSHKVSFSKQTTGHIRVFPRKGDVCALYRNDQTSDLVKNTFEIVDVDAYNEETGTTVTPLIKVSGFKTVFHRHLDPKETRVILENEMFMFSHRIPSCVLTGQEALKGCLELDPAAVPTQFLEVK